MRYYLELLRSPKCPKEFRDRTIRFWIETNKIEYVKVDTYSKIIAPYVDVRLHGPSDATTLLQAFHRIVLADGIVMSASSLSFAPVLLNNSTLKFVAPGWSRDFRYQWLLSSRFHRLELNGQPSPVGT